MLIICPKCNSSNNIIKNGSRTLKNNIKKQRYTCNSCNYKFVINQERGYPKEIILYALKLRNTVIYTYKKETKLSLREITRKVKEKFGITITPSIINIWEKKYKIKDLNLKPLPDKIITTIQEPISIDNKYKSYGLSASSKCEIID